MPWFDLGRWVASKLMAEFGSLACGLAGWLAGCLWPGWLAGLLAGWPAGRPAGWLAGWLPGWLAGWRPLLVRFGSVCPSLVSSLVLNLPWAPLPRMLSGFPWCFLVLSGPALPANGTLM